MTKYACFDPETFIVLDWIDTEHYNYPKVEHLVEIIDKENNEHINEIHHQQTYSIDTYLELLKKAGFNEVEYYGEFEEYYDKSQRIIFVCHKRRERM